MRGSIRTRLLAAFLFVAVAAAAALSVYFLREVEAYGLRRLEERLYTEARVSAALLGAALEADVTGSTGPKLSRPFDEALGRALAEAGDQTASRLVVIDSAGDVVADSGGAESVGNNYGNRPEIAKALRGAYGGATRMLPTGRVALYVAAPIRVRGGIVGVTYASSSTFSILTLLSDYRRQLAVVIVLYGLAALLITEMLSRALSRPLRELAEGATALATDHSVRVRPAGPRETRELADAFNHLAEEIETSSVELHEEERRKSRFVSDVSHELRSPLTGIRLAAETLLEGGVDEVDEKRFLATIIRESDRLTGLANDLLELQRIEGATGELPLGRVDLTQAARLAAEANEPMAAGRRVRVTVTGTAPEVLGSRDRIQQVIGNLVDNATRHTPEGCGVTVVLSREGDDAVVRVADEGPGIPEADLSNLFERFYRSQYSRDRITGGAGLGLAIVKAIVDAHHGTIDAANRPEGGAQFTVRLPALPD
ncbi:MAG: ATP-binding protein [Coriobacteriia bacterium]|nr:ATP-binding protein [Coriobacteriia bacterium]